jgi:hypothetical protein
MADDKIWLRRQKIIKIKIKSGGYQNHNEAATLVLLLLRLGQLGFLWCLLHCAPFCCMLMCLRLFWFFVSSPEAVFEGEMPFLFNCRREIKTKFIFTVISSCLFLAWCLAVVCSQLPGEVPSWFSDLFAWYLRCNFLFNLFVAF